MRGMAILLSFNLLGVLLHSVCHLPLPGNVLGLVIFTACLFLKLIKLEWVEQTSSLLLRHMLLFFAPVIVGVIRFGPQIRSEWGAIAVSLVGSTLAVMLVTGWVATVAIGWKREKQS
jgi:holin-like protein